jgi:MFS family permease
LQSVSSRGWRRRPPRSPRSSRALSDWLGRRKLLAVIGYGLAALTKPLFPLAETIGWVVAARVVDRLGKGIRGAPRDALVGDIAPADLRGACYGLRQSMDTVGAFAGPLLAAALMALAGAGYRLVFWVAVIPALISVASLVLGVEEPRATPRRSSAPMPIRLAEMRRLGAPYWRIVALASIFTMARFSEGFLILRAMDAGVAIAYVPLILVVMNVAYALTAYPAGVLSDRWGRGALLAIGFAALFGADLLLALSGSLVLLALGIVLWGLHMGATQGVFAALVADTTPQDLRGTAFGAFNFAAGIATLLASLVAGALWDALGPAATFLAGAGFTLAAALGWYRMSRIWRSLAPRVLT